jgi:hypothetical protein
MRAYFDHRRRFRLLRANQLEVVVSVMFSELEQAVIDQYGLKHLIVVERKPTVWRDHNGERQEIDHNIYLGQLVKHAHVEPVASPTHAAVFEEEVLAGLDTLKAYLDFSVQPPQAKVFDL